MGSLSDVTSPTGGLLDRFLSTCEYDSMCFFALVFDLAVTSLLVAGVAFLIALFFGISARFLIGAI